MMRLFVAAALALLPILAAGTPSLQASAQTTTERGLAVGAAIPAINVVTSGGESATFESLKGEKGLTLAFVRSADWCPFCKQQLRDLNGIAADLKAAGYPLVALSYDPTETLAAFGAKEKLAYVLVSDRESKVIDAFGLRNLDVANNARFNGIPHPAIYVIGADGVVRAKLMEERYQKRPPSTLVKQTVLGLK